MKRPASLAEVALRTEQRDEFDFHLAEFLDQFYLERRFPMLVEEPLLLLSKIENGQVADAYLAAVAVQLSRLLGIVPPGWARNPKRALRSPWFAHPGSAIRATLLAESPAAFRERNLFVSENALTRA